MNHRPHIDGLRGIAVLAVILYHMQLTWFGGGFVGVDVFFVISGYLIAGILASSLEREEVRFSLAHFYERRVRRILPALFAVLAVTTALAVAVLLPRDLTSYGKSLVATAAFASNVHLYRQVGYFDADAHSKPLLHTWSLAVEEQFYLVFPLLLFVLFRYFGGRVGARRALIVLGLTSFGWSAWQVWADQPAAFYLAPSRAWELLLGSALALGAVRSFRSRASAEVGAAAGLLLIAVAVGGFTAATRFPGPAALLPCLGAALIIHGGEGTRVSRALSWPPLVRVGLVSYSLYLWHWSLLTIAREWSLEPLTMAQTVGVMVVAWGASLVSWRYIEQPFRATPASGRVGRSPRAQSWRVVGLGAAGAVAVIAAGLVLVRSEGWPGRMTARVRALDAAQQDFNAERSRCHASDRADIPYRDTCRFGTPDATPRFALWGDSHAAELSVALGELAARRGESVRMITYSACPPGSVRRADLVGSAGCAAHERATLRAILADTTLAVVFLIARYTQAQLEQGDAFFDELGRVAHSLADAGLDVVLVYPAPEYAFSVPVQLARAEFQGRDPEEVGIGRTDFDLQREPAVRALDGIRRDTRIGKVDPAQLLCDAVRCRTIANGRPLYFDDDHLSVSGARFVAPVFAAYFNALRVVTR